MTSTLVIQSHTSPLPFAWLERCIESVRSWCQTNQFAYRWIGDELFDPIDSSLRAKLADRPIIASDLGRLYALREGLGTFDRVIWLDADFLIFRPDSLNLPSTYQLSQGYLLGREDWIQIDPVKPKKLKAYRKVHNAFLLFDRGNSFLDFYLRHAKKLLMECDGSVPSQFIGPKLLTALHNVVGCPVLETAGMLSPAVIHDILSEGQNQEALRLLKNRIQANLAGANLCSSVSKSSGFSEEDMDKLIDLLFGPGGIL